MFRTNAWYINMFSHWHCLVDSVLPILSLHAVDFLAKYCIISPEKLAAYRRAFEAVRENHITLHLNHNLRSKLKQTSVSDTIVYNSTFFITFAPQVISG